MRSQAQRVALPASIPLVAWDARRGVFLIGEENPDWAAVRARYDQLVAGAPPIVQFPRRTWAQRWRRFRRDLALAKAAFLGRL